jgi:RHS repeat-associated protein
VGALLGTIYYVNLDHLDTPRLIEDQNQATVWTWHQAESFGSTPPNEDPDGDGLKFSLPLRFPGQYFDKETGLHYNYFRDFDPNLGRYIQSDPIGLEGGINTYGYALGTPLRYTDARGLETILVTTYDYGFGSHSAIYVNTPGQPPFLYDPAGSYQPNGEPRGTGGFFEGNQANLQDYVKYQESTGSTVEVVKIPTTPAQEQGIKERAMDIGDPRGFSCASAVSQALGGACGISESLFPGSLRRKAERAQCKVR